MLPHSEAETTVVRGEPPEWLLRTYRALGWLAFFMAVSFWFVHRVTDPEAWDPLWLRVLVGSTALGAVLLSYRVAWVRKNLALIACGLSWIILLWFGALALANRLTPNYVVGYLFVYAGAGIVYGLGLRRPEPLGIYLAFGTLLIALGSLWEEDPEISPVIVATASAGIGIAIYLVLRTLLQQQQTLEEARQRAEAALQFRNTLLANMHHELRTPLAGILGAAQILNDEVPRDLREFVQIIEHSGRRLLHLLTNLVLLARMEADKLQLKPGLVDLREVMHPILQQLQEDAEEKGLTITCSCPEKPIYVYADPEALNTVFYNIVENAIKFTREGGVHVALREQGDRLFVDVQDSGPGIDPAVLERMFRAFEQGSTGLNRTHEGAGLGLTVAQRLLHLLGGTLTVRSQVGEGSTFTVGLRRAQMEVRMLHSGQHTGD
ncbi:sensor histidine kinase [Rhodothermus profundi]|uniref:histidine kinase n=1 Tax=Rhodothermus profundi TaxID=633813 RepID=A0A1M6W0D1_9BACT|nr:HAMP domain-containing sensor histidine kinase [Rhodothermus profundi]SHK87169.1 Signal transduction histidine kinase [Rhodothermus profundi]